MKYQGNPSTSLKQKANAWWKDRLVLLYSDLRSLLIHGIWWARNTTIFMDQKIPFEITSAMIVQWPREHKTKDKHKRMRLIKIPSIDKNIPALLIVFKQTDGVTLIQSLGSFVPKLEPNVSSR